LRISLLLVVGVFWVFSQELNISIKPPEIIYIDATQDKELEIDDNLFVNEVSNTRVAVIIPKNIAGRYSNKLPKAILSYLMYKEDNFEFEVYTIANEAQYNIIDALNQIELDGYKKAILLLTNQGNKVLKDVSYMYDIDFFIPTIRDQFIDNQNVYYGGIDYKNQIKALYDYIDKTSFFTQDNTYLFYTSGELSNYLNDAIEQTLDFEIKKILVKKGINYKPILSNKKEEFEDANIFINTPILKSSILLSQFRYYDLQPGSFLSSQINYNPYIFTLSQAKDREKLIIANSITNHNLELEDYNIIIHNDIRYDWINYSALIGVDYITNRQNRSLDYQFNSHQVAYTTQVFKASIYKFKKLNIIDKISDNEKK